MTPMRHSIFLYYRYSSCTTDCHITLIPIRHSVFLYYRLSHKFASTESLFHISVTLESHRNVTGRPSSRAVGRGHRHTSSDLSDWFQVGSRSRGRPASLFFILQFTRSWFPHPGLVTARNCVSFSCRALCDIIVHFCCIVLYVLAFSMSGDLGS